jgi:hypothetical protein
MHHAFSRRKPERRPVRHAAASFASARPLAPPPSERSNRVFMLLLYLILAVGVGLFLALVYGLLAGGGF